jgi:putative endonuclease
MERGGWTYFMTYRRDGILYAGVTSNLPRRAFEHREGLINGFTKCYGLKKLVYFERFDDIRYAI